MLEKKAKAGELVICMPEGRPLTDHLQNLGAEILDEFDSHEHPAFCLAEDLVALARTASLARG